MNWDNFWNIVALIIFSGGGIGTIIVTVVKYLSNYLAEKMLKKYDAKLQKEIEQYKHELEVEIERYKAKSSRLTYVTQLQFDTEFAAYQSIFENLYDFSVCTGMLYPILDHIPNNEEERKEMYIKRYEKFRIAFNSFSETLEKNAPFIPNDNYLLFDRLRQKANEIAATFPEVRIQDDPLFRKENAKEARKNYMKTPEFQEMVAEAKNQIREYLSTLKVDKD